MSTQELVSVIVEGLVGILVALLSYGAVMVTKYLESKKQNAIKEMELNQKSYFINKSIDLIVAAVSATNQNLVDALKEASADGRLTKEEAKEVFEKTKNNVLDTMSDEMAKAVKDVYGDVGKFLDQYIPSIVRDQKNKNGILIAPQLDEVVDKISEGTNEPSEPVEHEVIIDGMDTTELPEPPAI